jgi:hypothetical protein
MCNRKFPRARTPRTRPLVFRQPTIDNHALQIATQKEVMTSSPHAP